MLEEKECKKRGASKQTKWQEEEKERKHINHAISSILLIGLIASLWTDEVRKHDGNVVSTHLIQEAVTNCISVVWNKTIRLAQYNHLYIFAKKAFVRLINVMFIQQTDGLAQRDLVHAITITMGNESIVELIMVRFVLAFILDVNRRTI